MTDFFCQSRTVQMIKFCYIAQSFLYVFVMCCNKSGLGGFCRNVSCFVGQERHKMLGGKFGCRMTRKRAHQARPLLFTHRSCARSVQLSGDYKLFFILSSNKKLKTDISRLFCRARRRAQAGWRLSSSTTQLCEIRCDRC